MSLAAAERRRERPTPTREPVALPACSSVPLIPSPYATELVIQPTKPKTSTLETPSPLGPPSSERTIRMQSATADGSNDASGFKLVAGGQLISCRGGGSALRPRAASLRALDWFIEGLISECISLRAILQARRPCRALWRAGAERCSRPAALWASVPPQIKGEY